MAAAPVSLVRRLFGRGVTAAADPIRAAAAEAARLPAWARWRVWEAAYARDPGDAVAIRLARALIEALRYDQALALLAGEARAPAVVRARIRVLERIGDLTRAFDEATAFAALRPDDAAATAEADRLAREVGRQAMPLDAAPPIHQRDLPAARAKAAALIALDRPEDALAVLSGLAGISESPDDAARLMNATLLVGDAEAGARLATDGARRFPGDARFPRKCAQLAERDGDFDGALAGYRAALAIHRASAVDTAGIARMLAMSGDLGAARAWLDARAGSDLAFWVEPMRAFVETRAGDRAAAMAALDRAYANGRRIVDRYRAGRSRDRGDAYLLDGAHMAHPLARFARSLDIFDAVLARLRGGGSVALVGNGSRLLGTGQGPAIDGHDTVIRLNDFRTIGFEADVGSRTDIWISSVNRQSHPDRASIGDATAILIQSQAAHYPELPAFARGRLGFDLMPDRACFLPPFLHRLDDAMLYPVASTGMRAILMLEFVVQAPFDVIGFDFFSGSAMHYFDKGRLRHRVGESHAVRFERAFASEVLAELGRFGRFGRL